MKSIARRRPRNRTAAFWLTNAHGLNATAQLEPEEGDGDLRTAEDFVRRALAHFPANERVSDETIRAAALKVLKALPRALEKTAGRQARR